MINFLPKEEKNLLVREKTRKLFLIFGAMVLLAAFSFFLLLFSFRIYLLSMIEYQNVLLDLKKEQLRLLDSEEFQEEVGIVNKKLKELNFFYRDQVDLSLVLEKIAQLLPIGVHLNSFSFNKDTTEVKISGFAPTREILQDFKTNLEKEIYFKDVNFPILSWISPREIDFSATFKLVLTEL